MRDAGYRARRLEGSAMILDILALNIIGVLIGMAIWLVVLLGSIPGKVARRRDKPVHIIIKVVMRMQA